MDGAAVTLYCTCQYYEFRYKAFCFKDLSSTSLDKHDQYDMPEQSQKRGS
jgi:hypothetical protein